MILAGFSHLDGDGTVLTRKRCTAKMRKR
jgi:hypothetical protein